MVRRSNTCDFPVCGKLSITTCKDCSQSLCWEHLESHNCEVERTATTVLDYEPASKDLRLTLIVEWHFKNPLPKSDVERVIEGIKQIFTGSTEEGYAKVTDVKVEPIKAP